MLAGLATSASLYAGPTHGFTIAGVTLNTTLTQFKQSFQAPNGALLSCKKNAQQIQNCEYLNAQGQPADIQLFDEIPAQLTFQFRKLDQTYILAKVNAVFSVHYYTSAKAGLSKVYGSPGSAQQQSVNVYGAKFAYRDLVWEQDQKNQILILNQHYGNGLFSQIILKTAE